MQEIQTQNFNSETINLLNGILDALKRQSVPDELWNVDDIAAYIKKSRKTVYNGIVNQPNFPQRLRLAEKQVY